MRTGSSFCRGRWVRRIHGARGFTLTELMVVVVIMAVLATIGITTFRSYVKRSQNVEARSVISAISSAQRQFRSENLIYLNVSTNITTYYPTAAPDRTAYAWQQPAGANYANWMELSPKVTEAVQYGYATVAGLPGAAVPATAFAVVWPVPVEPWFLIQAVGDVDGNGVRSTLAASSFSASIAIQNPGE